MARPLIVDTARLETAGITLESLTFPTTPPPITAAGSDTASAAINTTMPEIESPVLDGLPAVRTALRSTAANIAAAASIYAQADRTLGENLMQLRFSVSDATAEGNTTAPQGPGVQGAAALARSAEIPIANAAIPDPATQLSTQLGQLNATVGAVNPLTQSVFQNVQSVTKGAPGAGQPGRGPDAVDEESTTEAEEMDGAGAAGGRHASPSAAPVQPLTATTVSSISTPLAPAPRPIVP